MNGVAPQRPELCLSPAEPDVTPVPFICPRTPSTPERVIKRARVERADSFPSVNTPVGPSPSPSTATPSSEASVSEAAATAPPSEGRAALFGRIRAAFSSWGNTIDGETPGALFVFVARHLFHDEDERTRTRADPSDDEVCDVADGVLGRAAAFLDAHQHWEESWQARTIAVLAAARAHFHYWARARDYSYNNEDDPLPLRRLLGSIDFGGWRAGGALSPLRALQRCEAELLCCDVPFARAYK